MPYGFQLTLTRRTKPFEFSYSKLQFTIEHPQFSIHLPYLDAINFTFSPDLLVQKGQKYMPDVKRS